VIVGDCIVSEAQRSLMLYLLVIIRIVKNKTEKNFHFMLSHICISCIQSCN